MKKILACFLMLTISCSQLWAGPGPDQKHIDKVKRKVTECLEKDRRVSVKTYDDRAFQGSVSEAGADHFVLTNEGRSTTLTYADVKNIKSPMSPGKKHAIIMAIVTGGFFGLLVGLLSPDKS